MSCYIPGPKMRGNGNVIKENREVYPFERIKVDGIINIILIQGEKEEIVVESDQNLLPFIHVYNNGKTLIVDTEDKMDFKFTKNNIYITFVELSEIKQDGVGNIKSEGTIESESLFIDNDGVGSIKININSKNLVTNLDGVGSIKLTGRTEYLDLKNSGVGSVDAFNLESDFANVVNSGVGSTEVFAQKEISINSSGVGSVKYRGNANIKDMTSSGIGSVKKIN